MPAPLPVRSRNRRVVEPGGSEDGNVDGKQKTVIEFDLAHQRARVMEACTQAAAEVAHQLVRKRPEASPGGTA
jgi:hypothetical protein